MRTSSLLLAAGTAMVVALAACSGDNSSTAPVIFSGSDSSTTSSGLTIVVDSATNNDTGAVATAIPIRVHVTQSGAGVASTTVTWAVVTGNGTLSGSTSVTDATGLATVNWTLGDTAGANSVTASITGGAITIAATSVGATAFGMSKISVDSQSVVAGGAVQLVARVIDRFGNAVLNANVNWSADGGTIVSPSTISGANGNASENFVTPSTPGLYNITASVPNVASVTFKVLAQ
jgi:hypothetical protein